MKKVYAFLLISSLIFDGSFVLAGKSYSSGGSSSSGSSRSYGGSSSSGRSYSSGGSKSYSGGSSRSYSGGSKSYSGGSSSRSYGSKSYSGGSSSSGSKGYSGGSKSYSGGGYSKPTPSYTPPKSTPSPSSSGRSYSSGGNHSSESPAYKAPSGRSYSTGPSTGSSQSTQKQTEKSKGSTSFNSGLSRSAQEKQSQDRYRASNPTPKSSAPKSYKTATGKSKTIEPNSPDVRSVKRYVTHERYVTYNNRASSFYGGYYGSPVYYHDNFSPFLWGWIMSDTINSHQRALWMYHHQSDMDSSRYNAMLARDARLQAEIDALKAQNLARDPNYVPPQMTDNPDLMYSKEFVDATYTPPGMTFGSFMWGLVKTVFWLSVVGGLGYALYYLIFVKEF